MLSISDNLRMIIIFKIINTQVEINIGVKVGVGIETVKTGRYKISREINGFLTDESFKLEQIWDWVLNLYYFFYRIKLRLV